MSHIAQLADTDLSLTRKAIQHLVYYGCLVLLDIFSFSAVYAPTAEIGGFIMEKSVQEECARYVRVPRMRMGSKGVKMGSESEKSKDERSSLSSEATRSDISTLNATEFDTFPLKQLAAEDDEWEISHENLITLYTSLRQGLTLKNWVLENLDLLHGIDIRRFITFGIIKGLLYRVHRYAISTSTSTSSSVPPAPPASLQSQSDAANHRDSDQSTIRAAQAQAQHLHHKPSLAFASTNPSSNTNPSHNTNTLFSPTKPDVLTRLDSIVSGDQRGRGDGLPLVKFLDGMHCFDEICTELVMSERKVEEKIKGAGDVQFFWR